MIIFLVYYDTEIRNKKPVALIEGKFGVELLRTKPVSGATVFYVLYHPFASSTKEI